MRRMTVVIVLTVMALAPLLWMDEAWARAGRGSSGGSRGSSSCVAVWDADVLRV